MEREDGVERRQLNTTSILSRLPWLLDIVSTSKVKEGSDGWPIDLNDDGKSFKLHLKKVFWVFWSELVQKPSKIYHLLEDALNALPNLPVRFYYFSLMKSRAQANIEHIRIVDLPAKLLLMTSQRLLEQ